jgi:hypothetical protein
MKKFVAIMALLMGATTGLIAQTTAGDQVEMADLMRSEGKIYVVVAILVLIFAGIVGYLIKIDRKLTKLEKGEE